MADIVKTTLDEASKYMKEISVLETRGGEFTPYFLADPRVTKVVVYSPRVPLAPSPRLEVHTERYAGEDFPGVVFIDPASSWEAEVYLKLSALAPLSVCLTQDGPLFFPGEQEEQSPPQEIAPPDPRGSNPWETSVLLKIKEILALAGAETEPEWFSDLLSPTYWPLWFKTFTAENIDPENNYEMLELIGDRTLEVTFLRIVVERAEAEGFRMEPKIATPLKSVYMSTEFQASLSDRLRLGELVRSLVVSTAIKEDVFEALFGAIFQAGNSVQDGLGYLLCQNLLGELLADTKIELREVYEKPKTRVIQAFKAAGWTEEKQKIPLRLVPPNDFVHGLFTVYLYPTPVAQNMGVPNPMGMGTGQTQQAAEEAAYASALQTLTQRGFTTQWFEEQKKILEFSRPAFGEVRGPFFAKLRREGLSEPYFKPIRNVGSGDNNYVQLLATDASGKIKLLSAAEHPNLTFAKVLAVESYNKKR